MGHPPIKVWFLEGLEDCLPTAFFRPAAEALVNGVVLAEALREISPGGSGARDPEHRVQKTAVVIGVAAGITRFARKQRLEALVLLVGQFVTSSHRRGPKR
jgi:hypothetical protein